MEITSPKWSYFLAMGFFLLLAGATYGFLIYRWDEVPKLARLMLLAAPACVWLPVLASLYNSWTFDFQPQGRDLFAGLIPLAVMCGGTLTYEPRWLRGIRLGVWTVLYGLSLYVVWFTVLGSSILV